VLTLDEVVANHVQDKSAGNRGPSLVVEKVAFGTKDAHTG